MATQLKIPEEIIIAVYESDKSAKQLSKKFNIGTTSVYEIWRCEKRFRHVLEKTDIWKNGGKKRKRKKYEYETKPKRKESKNSGNVKCLKCGDEFYSQDKRNFRICKDCTKDNQKLKDEYIFYMCDDK